MNPADKLLAIARVCVWILLGIALLTLVFWKQPEPIQQTTQAQTAVKQPQTITPLMPKDKIRDWKQADYNHRIALCIGFAVVSNKNQRMQFSAQDFYNCIDEATRGLPQTDDLLIWDVGRACDGLMRK